MVIAMIEELSQNQDLHDDELISLLSTDAYDFRLFRAADEARRKAYGMDVYIRGIIEFTNYCRNNCYYCGIRWDNAKVARYRLGLKEILSCCQEGYDLGFRTFVLQGGEDPRCTDDLMCEIVSEIRRGYDDCAITLSLGERSWDSYKALFDAGANRYLLRHETANAEHYRMLHPSFMSLENRKNCLWNLKDIGYQVGSGFMVGSPGQTMFHIVEDLRFLQKLGPAMIGIGPYIRHQDTPFRNCKNGDLKLCLRLIAVLRLMFPYALIPATTALGTIAPDGRERGLLAGANVVMPNLSPAKFKQLYKLYDKKICVNEEAAECKRCITDRVGQAGYRIVVDRGDVRFAALRQAFCRRGSRGGQ
jgi:biotin synthase